MPSVFVKHIDRSAPLQVYRCEDSHWHFMPHKNDDSGYYFNWYRLKMAYYEGKFHDNALVYVQGFGSEQFRVIYKYQSGFYWLRNSRGEQEWCMGRYGREDRKLYREEELSDTPWGNERYPPPAYQQQR